MTSLKFVVIWAVVGFCISCKNPFHKQGNLDVQISNIVKLNPEKFPEFKGKSYSADIDIVNNTDTVVNFEIMTCSWMDNFLFDNDSIGLYYVACNHNYPINRKLLPNNKISYHRVITVYAKLISNPLRNF